MRVCKADKCRLKWSGEYRREAKRKVYSSLDKRDLRLYRLQKAIGKIFYVVCVCFFIAVVSVAGYASELIKDDMDDTFAKIALLSFFAVSLAIGVSGFLYKYLKKKNIFGIDSADVDFQIFKETEKKYFEAFYKESYGAEGEHIVTKCFVAPDKSFENNDVLIFLTNGKLKVILSTRDKWIEADLNGCILKNPDTEEYMQFGKRATVISDGEDTLVLGKRAFSFIRRTAGV